LVHANQLWLGGLTTLAEKLAGLLIEFFSAVWARLRRVLYFSEKRVSYRHD
jgi:hypothetical protein